MALKKEPEGNLLEVLHHRHMEKCCSRFKAIVSDVSEDQQQSLTGQKENGRVKDRSNPVAPVKVTEKEDSQTAKGLKIMHPECRRKVQVAEELQEEKNPWVAVLINAFFKINDVPGEGCQHVNRKAGDQEALNVR